MTGARRSVSLEGAEQILRPPLDGLPHLRGDAAGRQTLEPGGLSLRDGLIAGLRPDPAVGCASTPGAAR